jgi:hypothetical protein
MSAGMVGCAATAWNAATAMAGWWCRSTLATPAPVRLPGWAWRGWERDFHDHYLEPEDRGPVALARLELRWPLTVDQLHRPARPRVPGRPNLVDATTAVAAVVGSVNHTAGPVLAALEGGG